VEVERGAFANRLVPAMLARSALAARDRALVTELVYGTTRMRRACEWLVRRHVRRWSGLDARTRALLRMGAYQLHFLRVPPHAAVSESVALADPRHRALVNAVLRAVAADGDPAWPDEATRLSYPDWIVAELTAALGRDRALAALARMNEPAVVTRRPDGYVQDLASQWVAAYVAEGAAGELVADVCAGPGGKATAIAAAGASVVALDVNERRAATVVANAAACGVRVAVAVADGRRPPLAPGSCDRVLVDAPCSGLGVLRRRPDARWRVRPADLPALAALQRELLEAAVALVRPGGLVVYSVCTLTRAETEGIDAWLAAAHPEVAAVPPPGPPWEPVGRGARLLPQAAGTDGMYLLAGRVGANEGHRRAGFVRAAAPGVPD
jgi:16S rRNA (cytosine967-C5)-methyltransferase